MSEYVKQNFQSGQILKAEQLNYIEDGISKILPAIEAGQQQLVTDDNGNLVWENKTHDYKIEEVVLYENYQFTAVRAQSMNPPSIALNIGDSFEAIVNGEIYEGTVERDSASGKLKIIAGDIVIVGLMPGITQQLRNFTDASGTLTLSVTTKIYHPIDKEYMPIACASGTGVKTAILNDGPGSLATGAYSTACNEGKSEGNYAFSINMGTASGFGSFAQGVNTFANGNYSYAGGANTIANGSQQYVVGKYNIEDNEDKYAYIVGNGDRNATDLSVLDRSNAYTLDWEGNGWFAGSMEATSLILKSSAEGSTKRFRITVNDSGTLSAAEITE